MNPNDPSDENKDVKGNLRDIKGSVNEINTTLKEVKTEVIGEIRDVSRAITTGIDKLSANINNLTMAILLSQKYRQTSMTRTNNPYPDERIKRSSSSPPNFSPSNVYHPPHRHQQQHQNIVWGAPIYEPRIWTSGTSRLGQGSLGGTFSTSKEQRQQQQQLQDIVTPDPEYQMQLVGSQQPPSENRMPTEDELKKERERRNQIEYSIGSMLQNFQFKDGDSPFPLSRPQQQQQRKKKRKRKKKKKKKDF